MFNNILFCAFVMTEQFLYQYLGIIINEHLHYEITATILVGSAGRALEGVISKFQSFKKKNGFQTFSKFIILL